MSKSKPEERTLQILRRRAEAAIDVQEDTGMELDNLSKDEIRRLVHELDVHRVELEMQNEELRRTQDELEEALDRYTDLYDYAPVGYLIVQSYGIITSANIMAGTLLGENRNDLAGSSIQSYIVKECQDDFYKLRRNAEKRAGVQSCEITMKKDRSVPFKCRVDCIAIPGEDGATAFRISFCEILYAQGVSSP